MKRSVTILLWILVGAAASGLGVGYFLHQANLDRERLAEQARLALLTANETRAATEQLAAEANQKLASASDEVAKAQALIKQYQDDQTLAAQATVLVKPSARAMRGWTESISVPLGLSLWIPPDASATATEPALIVTNSPPARGGAGGGGSGDPWLTISAYDAQTEQSLLQSATDTQPLNYLAAGRLLAGWKGTLNDTGQTVYLLRIRSAGASTHLIWAKAGGGVTEKKILETLSTLGFRS